MRPTTSRCGALGRSAVVLAARNPTLEHVWLGLTVLAAALACALQPLEPIDYWWSVRLGVLIRELGGDPSRGRPALYAGPGSDRRWAVAWPR